MVADAVNLHFRISSHFHVVFLETVTSEISESFLERVSSIVEHGSTILLNSFREVSRKPGLKIMIWVQFQQTTFTVNGNPYYGPMESIEHFQ